MRLKLYIPPHTEPGDGEHAAPLHYYTDQEFLVETDKYVVEKVLDHKPKRATSRGKKKWLVKYKGYPDPEWQPASSFMHDINEDWLAYNAKHRIDVGIKDVRMIYTPKSNPIEDLLEVEVIGSVTGSGRDQNLLQEDREWRTLCKMAQDSHKIPTLDYSGKGKRAVMRLTHSSHPQRRMAAIWERDRRRMRLDPQTKVCVWS